MIDDLKVLAVIPARGGSKGVPGKNIRIVGGKPLITWTMEAADRSSILDRIVVSTDDDEIMAVVRSHGGDVPFRRPAEISADVSSHTDVILHALEEIPEYDLVVMLNPTAPLRSSDDIDGCIRLCISSDAPACVSVSPAGKPPEWMFRVDEEGRMRSVLDLDELPLLRQNVPPAYMLNGAVYVARTEWFEDHKSFFSPKTRAYKMPSSRSIDLDDERDFMLLEVILRDRTSRAGR